jgi:gliding motility-associated-like protein
MKKSFPTILLYIFSLFSEAQSTTCNIAAIDAAMSAGGYILLNVQGQPCSRYFYNNNPTSNWNTASSQASAIGGFLVSINSAQENAAVLAAAQGQGFSGGIWIGFTDQVSEGNWVWTNGSSNSYTNWNGSEPSNSGGFPCYNDEDGAIMQLSNGLWNDLALNNGCPGAAQFRSVIEIDLCPTVIATSPSLPVCVNQPAQLSATASLGSPNYGYQWLNLTNSSNIGSGNSISVTPTAATNYAVVATDRYGCSAADTINLTTQVCNPVTCNIASIDAAMAAANFQFINVLNQPCSRYYYNPSATSNWNTASNQAAAVGATLLTINNATENAAVLAAAQAQGLTGGVWIGYTDIVQEGNWVWQDGTPSSYTNWNTGEPNNTVDICSGSGEDAAILQLSNGRWNDVYVNPGFPCFAPATYRSIVKVNLCPVITASATPTSVCAGQNVQLTASTQFGSPSYSYNWINQSSGASVASTPTTNIAPSASTSYQVTSTDRYGCQASRVVSVQVGNPNVNIIPGNNLSCLVTSNTLTAFSSLPNVTYVWSSGNNTNSININNPGTYTVTATDPISNCTASASLQVTQNITLPIPTISPSTGFINCIQNTDTLTVSSPSPTVYSWSTGDTSSSVILTSGGTYTVTATQILSGCTATASAVVSESTTPPIVSIDQPNNLNCNNSTVTLLATSPSAGLNYNWGGGVNTDSNSVNTAGTYTVTVTDPNNGCSSTASVTVSNTPNPSVVITQTDSISCFGICDGSLNATVSGGSAGNVSYLWNNAQTSNVISNLCSNTYSLTITDGDNCSASASFVVTQPDTVALTIFPKDTTINSGSTVSLAVSSLPVTTSINSYNWSPTIGLTCNDCANPTFNGSNPTNTYTLTATYANNCSATASVSIKVNPAGDPVAPSAFTPNGDGINDVFTVLSNDTKTFEMRIYNRWGKIVFESNNILNGWDGTFNGAAQPSEVYFGYYSLTKNDGSVVTKQFPLTLLR